MEAVSYLVKADIANAVVNALILKRMYPTVELAVIPVLLVEFVRLELVSCHAKADSVFVLVHASISKMIECTAVNVNTLVLLDNVVSLVNVKYLVNKVLASAVIFASISSQI